MRFLTIFNAQLRFYTPYLYSSGYIYVYTLTPYLRYCDNARLRRASNQLTRPLGTLVYLKAVATVQGSGYSFLKDVATGKNGRFAREFSGKSTTNAHFTEIMLSMPI